MANTNQTFNNPVKRKLQFDDLPAKQSNNTDEEATDKMFTDMSMEEQVVARQKAVEKWNFDFENEIPLQGDWEWERVDPVEFVESKEMVTSLKEKKSDNARNV